MRSEDRISNLSDGLIDAILIRMPLRDAVRTSILSRAWRYKWSTLPDLKFYWTDFPLWDVLSYDKKLVQMVDQVLLLHQGPINKFVLSTFLKNHKDIDRWILFLSRNDIREFLLQLGGLNYKVPSYLFSCDKINYLALSRCTMNPPALFDGFKNLRTLILLSVILSYNGLENLISNSPSLNKLTLRYINGCHHLKICAPNLVYLNVHSSLKDLCFEETPVLANVSISLLVGDYACKSNHLLGCLPSIKRLELLDKTFEILSASAGHIPVMLASKCELKYLKACINFEDTQEMLAALCIFRSSPFLQRVDIEVNFFSLHTNCHTVPLSGERLFFMITFGFVLLLHSFSKINDAVSACGFWRGQENLPCFSQLQILNMMRFKGTASELKFVEFVLANAPVLEMVKFEFGSNKANVMKIVGKLLRFRRVSSSAEIVIPELGVL